MTDQVGSYNTSVADFPGGRSSACSWTDASKNLWLFGGMGFGSSNSTGLLQDLWKFDVQTRTWTLQAGSDNLDQQGTYGTISVANPSNIPGSRMSSQCVSIGDTLWLFGGFGYSSSNLGYLSDLWSFNTSDGSWTWRGGAKTANTTGNYINDGTGTPGARASAGFWVKNNIFYMFGGEGFGILNLGTLSDLWQFFISTSPSDVTTGAVVITSATTTTNGIVVTGTGEISESGTHISTSTSTTSVFTSAGILGPNAIFLGVSLLGVLVSF